MWLNWFSKPSCLICFSEWLTIMLLTIFAEVSFKHMAHQLFRSCTLPLPLYKVERFLLDAMIGNQCWGHSSIVVNVEVRKWTLSSELFSTFHYSCKPWSIVCYAFFSQLLLPHFLLVFSYCFFWGISFSTVSIIASWLLTPWLWEWRILAFLQLFLVILPVLLEKFDIDGIRGTEIAVLSSGG